MATALGSFLCSALPLPPWAPSPIRGFKNPRNPCRCFVPEERSFGAAVPAVPLSPRSFGGWGSRALGEWGVGGSTAESARGRTVRVPELERQTHSTGLCDETSQNKPKGHRYSPGESPLKPPPLPLRLFVLRSIRIEFPKKSTARTCGEPSPGTPRGQGEGVLPSPFHFKLGHFADFSGGRRSCTSTTVKQLRASTSKYLTPFSFRIVSLATLPC